MLPGTNIKTKIMKEQKNMIAGRNAVLEAMSGNREIEKLVVQKNSRGVLKDILKKARENRIPIRYEDMSNIDKLFNGQHQGVVAFVAAYKYSSVDEILQTDETPFIVVLDNIEDPHNLGSVIRSCDGAGVSGVIIPKDRAVGLTATVGKVSAGAIEHVKVARVTNIANTIDKLKERGIWVAACDMDGEVYYQKDLTGSIALVIGNEGKGISRLVKEKCDFSVAIPMSGKINSLNAGNAAAILMYEVRRQRETS